MSQKHAQKKKRSVEKLVGLKEVRLNMQHYIDAVSKGEDFIVIKRGKPIFRMVPVDEYNDEGDWDTLVDFTEIEKKGVSAQMVSDILEKLINEDKRHGQQYRENSQKTTSPRKEARA